MKTSLVDNGSIHLYEEPIMEWQALSYWFNADVLRNWWKPPQLSWWITPSGTPSPWSIWDRILESPLSAHILENLLGFGIGFVITRNVAASCLIAVALSIKGQIQKGDALLPMKGYNWQNMVWRVIIGLVPIAVILGIWG